MKKLFVSLLLIGTTLLLSGCDIFYEGVDNIWYDEMNETLNISYSISRPDRDEETGEYPEESIHLLVQYEDSNEWEEIVELEDYKATDLQIEYKFRSYGNVNLKIERRNVAGELVESSKVFNVWINEPQYIHHFDYWFDEWSGEVRFNFGLNEMKINNVSILKSSDGGLNWVEVITHEPVMNEQDHYIGEFMYYEFEEGTYVYKLVAFDEANEFVADINSWGEIKVSYENKVFEGDPEVQYVGSGIDPYSMNVSIWWNAAGEFEQFMIYKSTDLENWVLVGDAPRIASNFFFTETEEGEFFYKVVAVNGDEELSEMISETSLRVKEGIIIGYFDGWVEWDTQNININWEFYHEDVKAVTVERMISDGPFELIGEFGGLKKMHTDEQLEPGSYTYRISVLDENGNILDQVVSKEFIVEQVNYMYHLNAWHNESTGEIEFNFGLNYSYVTNYVIEKSSDGGLTWEEFHTGEVIMNDDHWYQENVRVYEINEGVYAYRITGYDDEERNLGTVYNWQEVVVKYEHLNLEEPTEVHYVDGNYNIYDNNLNLWWNSQGLFETHLVEYSVDGETWVELASLPRITTYVQIEVLADGEYFFRISAVDADGLVKDSYATEHAIRVKQDAYINYFGGHYEWYNGEVNLYWDIIKEDVSLITVQRRTVDATEYTLIGEYGSLKTTLFDTPEATGDYVYLLTLLDEAGNILDQVESKVIYFEVPCEDPDNDGVCE